MEDIKDYFVNSGLVIPADYTDFDSAAVYAASRLKARDISAVSNFNAGLSGDNPRYGIIITTSENGSVSHDQPNDYAEQGTQVTITATPDNLYQFDKWIGPVPDKESPTITVDLQDNTYLKATFRLQN